MNANGQHSVENATAAIAVANQIGVDLKLAQKVYQNTKEFTDVIKFSDKKNGVWVIDDYAHNPAKCAASIKACQPLAEKVVALVSTSWL